MRVRILLRLVVPVLALGLLTGWTGDAGRHRPTMARVAVYERVATVIWGPVCHGQVAVTIVDTGRYMGDASWSYRAEGDRSTYSDCRVEIGRRLMTDAELCAVVVHEYGHLAGREHSPNPRSVMYPEVGRYNAPRRCT